MVKSDKKNRSNKVTQTHCLHCSVVFTVLLPPKAHCEPGKTALPQNRKICQNCLKNPQNKTFWEHVVKSRRKINNVWKKYICELPWFVQEGEVVSKSEAFQLNLSALAQVWGSPRGFVSYRAVRTPGPKHKSTCQHVVARNKIVELMRTDLLYL